MMPAEVVQRLKEHGALVQGREAETLRIVTEFAASPTPAEAPDATLTAEERQELAALSGTGGMVSVPDMTPQEPTQAFNDFIDLIDDMTGGSAKLFATNTEQTKESNDAAHEA